MALRARIYAYNRHLLFDVAFICSTLTHCGVCDLSVWRLKWEVSYVHQRVWRWKWFSCQSSYVLQRLRLCRASDTVFRREVDSQRQWGYGTCYGDSFPAAKECRYWLAGMTCDLSVWRLKWEVSYVHQRVWRWKWFSCQSSCVLQRLRLCRASDTVFRREVDSQRQWGYGTCYGDSFPAAKECRYWLAGVTGMCGHQIAYK